jgi:ankyrin repeat protein
MLLLEHGADPNAPLADVRVNHSRPQYPLMWAIAAQQPDFLAALVARGADLAALSDEHDLRRNALAFAAAHGCDVMIPLLLERGARSAHAVFFAIWDRREEMARQLYAAGCPLDYVRGDGLTTLHVAAERGMLWVLEARLAQHPEEVNLRDAAGATPLHLALRNRRAAVACWLLAHGADSHAQEYTTNYQPLHEAILYRVNLALIRQLLEAGANPNALAQTTERKMGGRRPTIPAWRPLDRAKSKGLDELLLRYGAHPTKPLSKVAVEGSPDAG